MTDVKTLGRRAWREDVIENVPSSGKNAPAKEEILDFVEAVGNATGVADLAALKAIPEPPSIVRVATGPAIGGWLWESGATDAADDVWTVQRASAGTGRYRRMMSTTRTVSLEWCTWAANPLQKALDILGADGGVVIVGNKSWTIPALCQSAASLKNLKIKGEGPDAALVFPNGGGGIRLTFETPSGTISHQHQLIVEDVAILTTYVSAAGQAGAGTAISASWEIAVGDKSQGVTCRNVQFGPLNHNAVGGQYARWGCGISLDNARQSTIDSCVFFGGSLQRDGWGVEIKGGTVQVQVQNCSFSDLDIGVNAHGVSEGIYINGACAFVNCNWKAYIDGDVVGSVRSTSATSASIGTGSKTFTVAHTNLGWKTINQGIFIRDAANPSVNWMWGQITSYAGGASVTINVTATGGAGTLSNWQLSPEHKISAVHIHDTHGACVFGQVRARWTAFVFYHHNADQKREGTAEDYTDILLLDSNTTWFINHNEFIQRAAAGYEDGIRVMDDGGNTAINIDFNTFVDRDNAIIIEGAANNCQATGNRAVTTGGVGRLIANTSNPDTNNRIENNPDPTNVIQAFAANDTTPSVLCQGTNYFRTANSSATSVTTFDGAWVGQEIKVLVNDANTTFIHSANLLLKGGANFAAASGDVVTFLKEGSTYWREVARSAA